MNRKKLPSTYIPLAKALGILFLLNISLWTLYLKDFKGSDTSLKNFESYSSGSKIKLIMKQDSYSYEVTLDTLEESMLTQLMFGYNSTTKIYDKDLNMVREIQSSEILIDLNNGYMIARNSISSQSDVFIDLKKDLTKEYSSQPLQAYKF